jgi:hypothetical protein
VDVKERKTTEKFKFSSIGLSMKEGFQMPKVIKATSVAIEDQLTLHL